MDCKSIAPPDILKFLQSWSQVNPRFCSNPPKLFWIMIPPLGFAEGRWLGKEYIPQMVVYHGRKSKITLNKSKTKMCLETCSSILWSLLWRDLTPPAPYFPSRSHQPNVHPECGASTSRNFTQQKVTVATCRDKLNGCSWFPWKVVGRYILPIGGL